jgi:hypothetical protein
VRSVDVPSELIGRVTAAVVSVIASIPGEDLVAVDLVYHSMYEGDADPTPVDVMACSRERRRQILRQQPVPGGLVYIWSNLEFDAYAEPEISDWLLGPAWQEVQELAEDLHANRGRDDDDDGTDVPRAVLIAVCRGLNEGRWTSSRPRQLAADAVIYPAARGGVDPDTAENLRAALTMPQQQQLEAAGLMLLY